VAYYDMQAKGFEAQPRIAEVARTLDFPLTYMLYRMEAKGSRWIRVS
jgi:hypothetical protein